MNTEPATLHLWTVYENPSDFPNQVVIRHSRVTRDGMYMDPEPLTVASTLEEAREALPQGLVCVPRQPEDDPVIVEVWI